jgi:hypothetical protein
MEVWTDPSKSSNDTALAYAAGFVEGAISQVPNAFFVYQ